MRPRYTFPAEYGENCVLLDIDKSLLPLVAGALKHFEFREAWLTEQDYEQGYNAFAQLRETFMGKCLEDIITEIRTMRGSVVTSDTSLETFPVGTYPGVSLMSLKYTLTSSDETLQAGEALQQIRNILQAQETGNQDVLEALGQIVALLTA